MHEDGWICPGCSLLYVQDRKPLAEEQVVALHCF